MIRRRMTVAGLFVSGVLVLSAALATGPASAGTQPVSTGGNCNGPDCWAGVSVQLQGDANAGGGNTNIPLASVPPPACIYDMPMSAAQMHNYLVNQYEKGSPGAPPPIYNGWDPTKIITKYKKHAQGSWYQLDTNPSASQAAINQCLSTDPSFVWVPAGQQPPVPWIPPYDLAMYALSKMVLPTPDFQLSPNERSYVTLPTFVTGLANSTGQRSVTATVDTLNGPDSATVTATSHGVTFDTPTPDKYTNCGPDGTYESKAQMDKAGSGTKPDCGVVYTQPSTGFAQGYPFTVNVSWTAVYTNTGQTLATIPIRSQTHYIPVAEIQSENNGG